MSSLNPGRQTDKRPKLKHLKVTELHVGSEKNIWRILSHYCVVYKAIKLELGEVQKIKSALRKQPQKKKEKLISSHSEDSLA